MKAMILAAGVGARMLPLTLKTPKPLLKIKDEPLIDRHLRRLATAGVTDVVVNLHHLGDQIENHVGDGHQFGLQVRYSKESELLETAGGIQKALPLLGDGPFIVINGDIYTDYDFSNLLGLDASRFASDFLAHLVMVDNPPHHPEGDFGIAANGALTSARPHFTYSGIGIYTPEFFSGFRVKRRMLREIFDQKLELGKLSAEFYEGFWNDVGTPERFDQLGKLVLRMRTV